MKSVATRRFWELFDALPVDVQKLAVKNNRLWRENPKHPSLRFRLLQGSKDRFYDSHRGSLSSTWPAGLENDNVDLDWYPRRV
jgi:hypothetical protein